MAELKDFAEKLVNLTEKEVNELADILKNEYGIEPAAAAVAVAGPAAGGGEAAGEGRGVPLHKALGCRCAEGRAVREGAKRDGFSRGS